MFRAPLNQGGGATVANNAPNNAGIFNPPAQSTGSQRSKFALQNAIPDEDIEDSDVVIAKDARGAKGTKHYNSIMETATKALDNKFGVPKHKIVTSEGADASSGNQTKSLRIQNTIMDLLLNVQEGLHRCKRMDFMDILLVPGLMPALQKETPTTMLLGISS